MVSVSMLHIRGFALTLESWITRKDKNCGHASQGLVVPIIDH